MIITNRINKNRTNKVCFIIAFTIIILPTVCFSQNTSEEINIFEDAKELPKFFSYGDTITIGEAVYQATKSNSSKRVCIVKANGKLVAHIISF